jgi:TIR domain
MNGPDPTSAGRIFISYRREETAYPAGWLYDRLDDRFGGGQVFKDVDSIPLGDDFMEAITRAVGSCDVLLALIGDRWVTVTDERGHRRLDDPDDFVRLEIEAALARNVRVIPVLVDGARMPRVDELPGSLISLVRRQALELSPSRFDSDTNRLFRVLESTLAEVRTEQQGEAPTAEPGRSPSANIAEVQQDTGGTEHGGRGDGQNPPPAGPVIAGDAGSPSDKGESAASGRRRRSKAPIIAAVAVAAVVIALIAAVVARSGGRGGDPSDSVRGIEVDSSPVTSPDGLRLTGLQVHARNDPPLVNDTLTVSYSLTNVNDEPLELADTFVGVRNEARDRLDTENENEGIVLEPGETVTAEGRVILDSEGTWRVWPCYTLPGDRLCPDFWKVTFVPVQ